jgi:hypothetical protein
MSDRTLGANTPAARVLFPRQRGAIAVAFSFVEISGWALELSYVSAARKWSTGEAPRMQTPQQRQSPRHPLRRLANVTPSKGGPSQLCIVTNMSDGGVRVQVLGAEIPGRVLADATRRPTGRCWQMQGSLAARGLT